MTIYIYNSKNMNIRALLFFHFNHDFINQHIFFLKQFFPVTHLPRSTTQDIYMNFIFNQNY